MLFPPKCAACGRLLEFRGLGQEIDPLCEVCRSRWESELLDTCGTCGMAVKDCNCMTEALSRAKCVELRKRLYYLHGSNSAVQNRILYKIKNQPSLYAIGFLAEELEETLREMMDASALPYKENLRITKEITECAHALNVSVEAELGRLVTGEAGSNEVHTDMVAEDYYTDPDEAAAFCKATGIDALAIAFGTAHGFYTAQPKLDFNVVKNVARATGLPLVMHGGSGVSEEGFRKAIANGIRKINYYSYMSKAGYMAAKDTIEQGKTNYLHDVEYAAMHAMKEDVKKAIRIFANL